MVVNPLSTTFSEDVEDVEVEDMLGWGSLDLRKLSARFYFSCLGCVRHSTSKAGKESLGFCSTSTDQNGRTIADACIGSRKEGTGMGQRDILFRLPLPLLSVKNLQVHCHS